MTPNGHERARPLRTGDPAELGEYRILGRLGRGGMGTVYLGEDAAGRAVAVKLIHPDLSDDDSFRRRFTREVEAARRVARFSTAAVLDARLDSDPLFIVSEYVAGPNLAEAVRDAGPMSGGTLESLAMGVAAALTAIHGAGVVHRDLKPANVLLSSVGPKVIDFGIARALDDDSAVTRSSQLMGTPAYLAPELIAGEPLAAPSDIFSWGCLVAYAGTGRAPFDGPTVPAVLHQIISQAPDLDGLDPAVRELVEGALDKNPDNRPTAQQLLNRLIGREETNPDTVTESVVRSWTPPSTARPGPAGPDSGPNAPVGGGPSPGPTADLSQEPTAALPGAAAPSAAVPSDPSGGRSGGHGGPADPAPPAAQPVSGGRPPGAPHSGPSGPNHAYAPPPPDDEAAPVSRPLPTRAVGLGALALAVVAAVVLGGLWLFDAPEVPQGTQIYSDDFTVRDNGWGDRDFDPEDTYYWSGYHEDGYAVSADGDRRSSTGYYAPFDSHPPRVRVSATATVLSGPPYGTFGVSCLRDDGEDDDTYYRANVRVDGTEAEIRREAGEAGSSHLERTGGDPVPGFEPTSEDAEEPAANTLDLTCALDAETDTVTLNLWVNGEHVLEAVDDNPLPLTAEEAPQAGIAAARGVGGGDNIVVVFTEFALYRLPEESQR